MQLETRLSQFFQKLRTVHEESPPKILPVLHMGQSTSSVIRKLDVLNFTWDKRYILKSAESKVKAQCRESKLLCQNYDFIPHVLEWLN